MDEPIVVVDADEEQCEELCAMLEREHYRTTALHSLINLEENVHEGTCRAVILDLDTVPVGNRALRELKRKNPDIFIICLSKRKFHPELEEAISRHIYACLGKPVDPDELVYLLRSIYKNDADPRDPPES